MFCELIFLRIFLILTPIRFYIRCTNCSAEITFKTDPKNADYACEYGASRNFEPWRKEETENEEAKKKRKEEDADSMRALENKTIDNRQEMDILDALDELRSLKARREQLSFDEILGANIPSEEVDDSGLTSADREYITKVFEEKRQRICRLKEDDGDIGAKRKRDGGEDGRGEETKKKAKKTILPTVVVKSRKLQEPSDAQDKKDGDTPAARITVSEQEKETLADKSNEEGGQGGLSILQGYGSETSD